MPANSHLLKDMLIVAVVGMGLVFSESRSGILTAVVGSLIVIGIAYFRTRRRSVIAIGLLFIAIPLTYAVWIGVDPVISRFRFLLLSGSDQEIRLSIWRDTIALIRDSPLLGTGLGTYTWSSRHYQTSGFNQLYDHAHNDYLEFAADIGLPGAVLLFSGLWSLTVKVGRKVRVLAGSVECITAAACTGALASLLIHGLTDFNLQIPANAFVFAWIAGTAAALVRKPTTGEPKPRHRSARLAFHGPRHR
jgi:O-antigen ligase